MSFKPGDKVFRKADLNKRYVIGRVLWLSDDNKKARVEWADRSRLGGSGFRNTSVSCTALVLATEEEIARRRALREERMAALRKTSA